MSPGRHFTRLVRSSRRSRALLLLSLCAAAGCSSGSSKNGGTTSSSGDACSSSCDAQAKACPAAGADYAAFCKQLCASIPTTCSTQYDAYASCLDGVGWQCSATATVNGNPAPEPVDPTQCQSQGDAYEACAQSSAPPCAGADDAGFCPSVACDCPSGTTQISGSASSAGGGCACYDATTCQTSPGCT